MEDALSCVACIPELPACSYFGVFDGHGGAGAAHLVSNKLLSTVIQHLTSSCGEITKPSMDHLQERLAEVLPQAFVAMDEYLAKNLLGSPGECASSDPGTTAVTSFITPSHIIIAHVGDARYVQEEV